MRPVTCSMLKVFLFLLPICSVAQIQYDTTLVNLLFSDTAAYNSYNCRKPLIWDETARQVGKVLKSGNTIYYLPDQHGAVFVAVKTGDSITVARDDRTRFWGYNGGHYCFIANDQIYSFGGYGLWRTNGHLRMYVRERQEWDIIKLNLHVPSFNEFTYFDPRTGKLWCGKQDDVNENFDPEKSRPMYTMYCLDLNGRNWEAKGDFLLRKSPMYLGTVCETPYGPLVLSEGPSFHVLDFERNIKYELRGLSDSLKIFIKPEIDRYSVFYINGLLMFHDLENDEVAWKFPLKASDLAPSGVPVYREGSVYVPFLFVAGLIFASATGFYLFRRKMISPRPVKNSLRFWESLTPIEKEILAQIKKDTESGVRTKTEDLNRILGTEKKSFEVQKSQRSKKLLQINEKYSSYFRNRAVLIDKSRMDGDRRLVEYFIRTEALSDISKEG